MSRYFRLYLRFLEFSFGKAMEFRMDFYFRIFMDVVFYAVQFGFFKVLFLHGGTIGGWSEPQMMIFIAVFITIDAICMTLFSNNAWILPQLVNKGDLDYYLVRPVSSFFMLNFRDFAVNSAINLLMTLAIFIWALWNYPEQLGVFRILSLIVLVIVGAFISHLMRLLFILPVFWTHSSRGFDNFYWNLSKFAERPHGIYKGYVRLLFFTLIPLVAIASMPTQVLFSDQPFQIIAYCLIVLVALYLAVKFVWSMALRNYSSASS